jgi:hypothetical protein
LCGGQPQANAGHRALGAGSPVGLVLWRGGHCPRRPADGRTVASGEHLQPDASRGTENSPAKFAATATVLQAHGRFRGRSKSAAGALPQVSEAPDSGDCAASTAGGGDDAGRNRMRSLTDPSQLGGLLQPLSGGSDGCAQEWKMWHASSIVPLNSKVEGGRPGTPERASTHVRDIAAYIQICHI